MAVEQTALARLDADISDFISKMDEANAVWDQRLGALESRATRLGGAIKDSFGESASASADAFGGAFGLIEAYALKVAKVVAVAMSAMKIGEAIADFHAAELQMRLMGQSGATLQGNLEHLAGAALRNGQSVKTMAEQVRALSQTQTLAGRSTAEIIDLETKLADAFAKSGKTAAENGGAFDALKTIARENKVEIGNYNTLLDKTPTILFAVAAGLREAGGDIQSLRRLIDDGKLSGTDFFRAFEAGRATLGQLPSATSGIDRAMESLKTGIGQAAGELDKATGASETLQSALNRLAEIAPRVGAAIAQGLRDGMASIKTMSDQIATLPTANSTRPAGRYGQATVGPMIPVSGAIQGPPQAPTEAELDAAREARRNAAYSRLVAPVSASDHPPPPAKKDGSGDTLNAYQKEIEASQKRIDTLKVETAVINSSRLEQFRALEAQKLLTAAKEAGIQVTDELKKKIDEQALAEARAKVAAEEAARARQKIVQASDSFRSDLTSGITSFATELRSAFEDGKISAEEYTQAVRNMFGRLADYILEIGARNLVASFLGLTGTPIPGAGAGFAALFGRAGGGPVNAGQAYRVGETGPELFVPRGAGTIIPARSAGGMVMGNVSIYAPNADRGQLMAVQREVAGLRAEVARQAGAAAAQKRGMRA